METNIPIEFQLPDDVRAFFKDGKTLSVLVGSDLMHGNRIVATGPKGTYVDNSEIKQPRLKYVTLLQIPLLSLNSLTAATANWKTVMRTDCGTEMVLRSCVSVAEHQHCLPVSLLLPLLLSVPEDRHPKLLVPRLGRVLYPATIAAFIGILTVSTLPSPQCLHLRRNGCVPITQNKYL